MNSEQPPTPSIRRRWWEFERRILRDAVSTSRNTFVGIRNGLLALFLGFAAAAFIFRKYIESVDIYRGVIGFLGLAAIYFIWRNHCAVFRIYKEQADALDRHQRQMSPQVFLAYVEQTCRRKTYDTRSGTPILYFSVEVSGPPRAVARNARVFLKQVERQEDGRFESVGIEGSPSLEWTVSDNAPNDAFVPTNIGPGHTRVVNVFHAVFGQQRMLLCKKAMLNRELELLRPPGVYRFIVRANCDDWNGYAELVLRVVWDGDAANTQVYAE